MLLFSPSCNALLAQARPTMQHILLVYNNVLLVLKYILRCTVRTRRTQETGNKSGKHFRTRAELFFNFGTKSSRHPDHRYLSHGCGGRSILVVGKLESGHSRTATIPYYVTRDLFSHGIVYGFTRFETDSGYVTLITFYYIPRIRANSISRRATFPISYSPYLIVHI